MLFILRLNFILVVVLVVMPCLSFLNPFFPSSSPFTSTPFVLMSFLLCFFIFVIVLSLTLVLILMFIPTFIVVIILILMLVLALILFLFFNVSDYYSHVHFLFCSACHSYFDLIHVLCSVYSYRYSESES